MFAARVDEEHVEYSPSEAVSQRGDLLRLRDIDSLDLDPVGVTEREAVELAALTRPDVITSDVRLIEGTGPNAVALIHSELGHIPTIFITGSTGECDPGVPAIAILPKPFAGPALTEAFATARTAPNH